MIKATAWIQFGPTRCDSIEIKIDNLTISISVQQAKRLAAEVSEALKAADEAEVIWSDPT